MADRARACYTTHMGNAKRLFRLLREDSRLPMQAMRYGVAAAAGFAADYLVLVILKETCGLHVLAAVPIAFVVGVAVNYLVGVTFVFCRGKWTLPAELSMFLLISLAAMALTEGCMYVLTDSLRLDYRIARVLTGVVTYLFNFFTRRWLLYRGKKKDGPSGEMDS